ncbi:MAG: hypothetical protein ACNA70_03410 [Brevefilum sp.]
MPHLTLLAFVVIVMAAMINLVFRDWRVNAAGLGVQYLAAFVLVMLSWPIELAIVKLITGWMATAAIAFTCLRQKSHATSTEVPSNLFFRGLAGLLVVLLIFILAPALHEAVFPAVDLMIIQGGLMLMGMSLMQLGMNSKPYLVIISLLSFLTGFEVIHAALELSTLLTGLLVIVNLGLALVGVYLMVNADEANEATGEGEAR